MAEVSLRIEGIHTGVNSDMHDKKRKTHGAFPFKKMIRGQKGFSTTLKLVGFVL